MRVLGDGAPWPMRPPVAGRLFDFVGSTMIDMPHSTGLLASTLLDPEILVRRCYSSERRCQVRSGSPTDAPSFADMRRDDHTRFAVC